MRLVILTLALIACAQAASIFDVTMDSHWANYKIVHNKNYGKSETVRRLVWEANMKYINQHNQEADSGVHTFTLGMNKYGDMTGEEFGAMYNGYNKTGEIKQKTGVAYKLSGSANPDSKDWRTEGYVTPVKDQGQCGSCWAFSAVAGLEGQHFKASGKLVSLSEQNLVDCSRKQGNQGCNGGLMDQAFTYIKVNKGIDTEDTYKYVARDQSCKFNAANVGATDTGFVDITAGDESALVDALATIGPISVAIDASHSSFQLYKSGIYNEKRCSSEQLDHGVTAVGYGSNAQGDFYIVKNSWAEVWGMDGYIMMSRNKNNQCGIASAASYPLV
jgi:cathepsin L